MDRCSRSRHLLHSGWQDSDQQQGPAAGAAALLLRQDHRTAPRVLQEVRIRIRSKRRQGTAGRRWPTGVQRFWLRPRRWVLMAQPLALRAASMRCLVDDELDLILMTTVGCNLRCTYCYETFALGRMRAPVVSGIKQLIRRRIGDLRALRVGWFGGEPLLAIDIIDDVMTHVRGLAARYPSVCVSSDMSTNGYTLSQPRLQRLLDLGVRGFQVSLDGPAECHDRTRVKANGGGTFERIWSNLLAARQLSGDFGVTVRLHVHRDNA